MSKRIGKGWVLAGRYFTLSQADTRIKELKPKGFETALNKTNQAFKSAQNTKTVKEVWKVWARDKVTIKRYKPDGRRRY